jgi:hypothetical protein
MSFISSSSFVVLINGSPSKFFHSSRGLHQGCPLSPFLFLIVAKGLSKLIQNAKISGMLKGLQICDLVVLTHLPFVDDVMIFGVGFSKEL